MESRIKYIVLLVCCSIASISFSQKKYDIKEFMDYDCMTQLYLEPANITDKLSEINTTIEIIYNKEKKSIELVRHNNFGGKSFTEWYEVIGIIENVDNGAKIYKLYDAYDDEYFILEIHTLKKALLKQNVNPETGCFKSIIRMEEK
ncbi:MAG: hypothetical protein H6588_08605 [Flavobacteriales bacterium]|nr:hypothetical protein [Flavobacteriales bacterium]